jgi:hypothetical protein
MSLDGSETGGFRVFRENMLGGRIDSEGGKC